MPSIGFRLSSIRVLAVVNDRVVFRAGQGLTPAERMVLEVERRGWFDLLNAGTYRDHAVLVRPVLQSRASRTAGESMEVRTAAYLQALAGLSRWAVAEACRGINDGTAAGIDRTFTPTPAEIADLARASEARARKRLLEIGELLEAREEPPEPPEAELRRRAEKATAASRLIAETAVSMDMRRVVSRDRAAEAREMASRLVPMTDEDIAALRGDLEGAAA